MKNKQICYCFSTLEPQFLLKFSSKVTSPHLTSSKIEVISKSPHLTPKKIEVIFNHLTSPQRKWGDFKVTSPHLGKIEAISKSTHLTSPQKNRGDFKVIPLLPGLRHTQFKAHFWQKSPPKEFRFKAHFFRVKIYLSKNDYILGLFKVTLLNFVSFCPIITPKLTRLCFFLAKFRRFLANFAVIDEICSSQNCASWP